MRVNNRPPFFCLLTSPEVIDIDKSSRLRVREQHNYILFSCALQLQAHSLFGFVSAFTVSLRHSHKTSRPLSGTADEQLNPKKKIFEQVQPDLRISDEGVAVYKGVPWKVRGHEGTCNVPSMKDTPIK